MSETRPVSVTDNEFQSAVLDAAGPVLVDFWAPWCGPCRTLAPVIEEIAEELGDRVKVTKVNTEEHPFWAMRYGVRGIPTLILFDGGQEVGRMVGAYPRGSLFNWIEGLLAA